MKKILFLLFVSFSLVGCKALTKEIKRTNKMRKAALEVCDCNYVGINSSYENGNSGITFTIREYTGSDMKATADAILKRVQEVNDALCNKGELFVIFEGETHKDVYTYYGCGDTPDHEVIENESEQLEEEDTLAAEEGPIV